LGDPQPREQSDIIALVSDERPRIQ
jgi:hypothetical protein